jgi:restriction system protein
MLPLLKLHSDGQIHDLKDLVEPISTSFDLTPEERLERVSNGNTKIQDRIGWAKTFLKKAGMLSSPKRRHHQITDRGLEVLNKNLSQLYPQDIIKMYPDVMQNSFYNPDLRVDKKIADDKTSVSNLDMDPIQNLENGYLQYREGLASELLDEIKNSSPQFFEKLVVDLLLAMGYGGTNGEGKTTQVSKDGGIDGVIKEDRLGLDMIYLQAKKWENTVSRPEIDKFIGALSRNRARKGVFITTSEFSKEAVACVDSLDAKIVLIDGQKLVNLMIDFGVGVSIKNSYEIKAIDSDYFE